LFKKEVPLPPKKTQAELYKDISHGYYGEREDLELLDDEKAYE
jgi:hypothetical protein